MAISPIPKKKPEPENDRIQKCEILKWQNRLDEIEEVKEMLQDEEVKKDLLDYIFGFSDTNPLQEIRKKYK